MASNFGSRVVNELAKRQLKDRFNHLIKSSFWPKAPRNGWIRSLRESMDMSGAQLGKRVGLSRNRVSILERKEAEGAITLDQLNLLAEGLNARVVYAVIPNNPIDETIEHRLRELAESKLKHTNRSMFLESQQLNQKQQDSAKNSLIEQLRQQGGRVWWNKDMSEKNK